MNGETLITLVDHIQLSKVKLHKCYGLIKIISNQEWLRHKLWESYSKKQRNHMIVGTIFKMDVKLIESSKQKPYLMGVNKILWQSSLFLRSRLHNKALKYLKYWSK